MATADKQTILDATLKAANSLGYDTLKSEQGKATLQFVSGNDVFVSIPTGYGKSLCFALLPFVFDAIRQVDKKSMVMIVSPLIALMKDHVATFTSKGISAAYVSEKESDRGVKEESRMESIS